MLTLMAGTIGCERHAERGREAEAGRAKEKASE